MNLIYARYGFGPDVRANIRDYFFNGHTIKEIAAFTGCDEVVVRQILKRILPKYGRAAR
jgi:DNA-directed RNA polymerase specialized sigma24 family protein